MNSIISEQEKYLNLNHQYRSILGKICLLSSSELESLLLGNLDALIAYGLTCKDLVRDFGLYDYIGCAETIHTVWRRIQSGEQANKIDVDKKLLFQYMSEICMLVDNKYDKSPQTCPVCREKSYFLPISNLFTHSFKRYNTIPKVFETLNMEEYACPNCSASDRDRLMVMYMENTFKEVDLSGKRLLHIAPSISIENWIYSNYPELKKDTTDLYMENVTFTSDIQNMSCVADESYDYVICSHVLEHVRDDMKAFCELKRIIKKGGQIIFLVPIALDIEEIDEEWGLTSEENWHRFGQDDHSRIYSKKGLLERITESELEVKEINNRNWGEGRFSEYGISESSVLYILTK